MCNLFELAFALDSFRSARYTVLTSSNKDETAVHGYSPTFIGSCRVGVSQNHLFYVLSALQLCLGIRQTTDTPGFKLFTMQQHFFLGGEGGGSWAFFFGGGGKLIPLEY